MMCERCHAGELAPTQVPRLSDGTGKVAYLVGSGVVLMVGASVGFGLALVREGGVEPEQVVIPVAIGLLVSAPIVLVASLRMLSEKEVLRCRNCAHTFNRA